MDTNKFYIPNQVATMPNPLYHSLKGQYFVGTTDDLYFESGKKAWAALVNPIHSGKNLFVNVWTVTDLHEPPLDIQIWLNSMLPGNYTISTKVTPVNTAIMPPSVPRVKLLQASNVSGSPVGGVNAYGRVSSPGITLVSEEDGKFIIPPGGNFAIVISATLETAAIPDVRVACGWWEE